MSYQIETLIEEYLAGLLSRAAEDGIITGEQRDQIISRASSPDRGAPGKKS